MTLFEVCDANEDAWLFHGQLQQHCALHNEEIRVFQADSDNHKEALFLSFSLYYELYIIIVDWKYAYNMFNPTNFEYSHLFEIKVS